jgi:hypothetical protein
VIPGIAQFQLVLWGATAIASLALLTLLVVRKNYRAYPAFSFYIFLNLVLGVLVFFIYRRWGFTSRASWYFTWGLQAMAISARAIAVAEICKHFLDRYPGVWALAKRVLLAAAGLVLLYSGLAARHQWQSAVSSADRAVELAIAAVIVILFLFARYYDVQLESADRSLAIGFFLYSCFYGVNNTILERYLREYDAEWSLLAMLAFLASLFLWTWGLRKTQIAAAAEESLLPKGVYQSFAPQINLRLRGLNDQLSKIWKTEVTRH